MCDVSFDTLTNGFGDPYVLSGEWFSDWFWRRHALSVPWNTSQFTGSLCLDRSSGGWLLYASFDCFFLAVIHNYNGLVSLIWTWMCGHLFFVSYEVLAISHAVCFIMFHYGWWTNAKINEMGVVKHLSNYAGFGVLVLCI